VTVDRGAVIVGDGDRAHRACTPIMHSAVSCADSKASRDAQPLASATSDGHSSPCFAEVGCLGAIHATTMAMTVRLLARNLVAAAVLGLTAAVLLTFVPVLVSVG
jgi:hypothetical protein